MRVPEGWRETTLGEHIEKMVGGGTPSKDEARFWNGRIPWASVKDLTGPWLGTTIDSITEEGLASSASNLIPQGTVILATRMAVGKAVRFSKDVAINQDLRAIFPKSDLSPEYLHWLLIGAENQLSSIATGTTVKGIRQETVKTLPILLPPLREQRRIAEILSSFDNVISVVQAIIQQTRVVKKAMLERLLTRGIGHTRFKNTDVGEIPEHWDLQRLGDISEKITSGSRGWAQYYADKGALFLRSQNIRSGRLDLSDQQFVNIPAGTEGNRTLIKADDLLFTITGNGVGNVAKAPGGLGEAYVSQHIALVRLHDRKLADILMAYFSPDGPGNAQIAKAQYGQSKPGLSLDNVRNLLIPFPPPPEVSRITEVILEITSAETKASEKLEVEMALRSVLLSDLLTGRKRVTADALLPAE